MSVESEILRIQHNVADSYAAVAGKGGTVPLQPTSANLAAAVASIPTGGGSGGDVYSTEETRIGTWIDGKPIYRKTLILTSPSNNAWLPVYQDTEIGFVVKEYGILKVSDTDFRPLSELGSAAEVRYVIGEGIQMFVQTINYAYKPVFLTVEYTKTTD